MTALSSKTASAAGSARVLLAPAGRTLQDLVGLDDRAPLAITRTLPCSSERRAAGPEPAVNLMQVGHPGLLHAISTFARSPCASPVCSPTRSATCARACSAFRYGGGVLEATPGTDPTEQQLHGAGRLTGSLRICAQRSGPLRSGWR
jgi:hypothetical protein